MPTSTCPSQASPFRKARFEKAARLGLIPRLVPDDQIAAEAERVAQQFTTNPYCV